MSTIVRTGPAATDASGTVTASAFSGKSAKALSSKSLQTRRVDIADHGDDQLVLGEQPFGDRAQVVRRNRIKTFDGSFRVAGVGVIAESDAHPGPHRNGLRVVFLTAQGFGQLRFDPRKRVVLETRLIERKPQQFERLVLVVRQGLQTTIEVIAARIERHANGDLLQRRLKGLGIEIAGALVQHAGKDR